MAQQIRLLRNKGRAMDLQSVIDIVTGVVGAVLGWFVKIIWDAIKELQTDMKETTHTLHENYVRKDDYRIEMAEIKGMFNRIMDKLEQKVDKG